MDVSENLALHGLLAKIDDSREVTVRFRGDKEWKDDTLSPDETPGLKAVLTTFLCQTHGQVVSGPVFKPTLNSTSLFDRVQGYPGGGVQGLCCFGPLACRRPSRREMFEGVGVRAADTARAPSPIRGDRKASGTRESSTPTSKADVRGVLRFLAELPPGQGLSFSPLIRQLYSDEVEQRRAGKDAVRARERRPVDRHLSMDFVSALLHLEGFGFASFQRGKRKPETANPRGQRTLSVSGGDEKLIALTLNGGGVERSGQ